METLQRTANRGSVSTGYDIDNSYKNENDNAEKMTHTYDSAPTSQQKGTISIWYKRTEINTNIGIFQFGDDASGDYLAVRWTSEANGSLETYRSKISGTSVNIGNTNGAVKDTSAWYHMVIAIDTTQATATNRFRVYRNGEELAFSTDNRSSITQNSNMAIGENGKDILIGEGVYKFNGYIAEVNYVDGQQLSSTDFGEYDSDSGIWIPKKYTGTYGNNGFYLDFKNASNLGEDQSGNNHDFTLTNITSADQATDTPTNNFCTFNPIFSWFYGGNDAKSTILNGATTADNVSGTSWKGAVGTIAVNKGKWYWEWENNAGAFGHRTHGILTTEYAVKSTYQSDDYSNQIYFRDGSTPTIRNLIDGTASTLHNMTAYTSNNADVFGIALNMDDQEATFYRNGSAITIDGTSNTTIDISSVDGDTKYVYPLYSCYGSTEAHYNFGGFTAMGISSGASDENGYGTFEYAPPSGYFSLCTKNLAELG
jgi:hypothetical protein